MKTSNRWSLTLAALAAASALVACGGGGSGSIPEATTTPIAVTPTPAPTTTPSPAPDVGAPALLGNISVDGMNWINYRRAQIGMPQVTQNSLIDRAAQAHSDYQRLNGQITHDEVVGKAGFTGVGELERLAAAGYTLTPATGYAYGEVISATSSGTGAFMVDELITAIYHRFVIFEPMFKEIGTGSATASRTTYFTADFASNNGFGPGIGRGKFVNWPYNGQTGVTPNFFSDNEEPDPDPDRNEVGYPISVHADISAYVTVNSFTVRPRGGAVLPAKLLQHDIDPHTVGSAAAIVPQAVLKSATTYDVSFDGVVDGIPVTRSWSFTTK